MVHSILWFIPSLEKKSHGWQFTADPETRRGPVRKCWEGHRMVQDTQERRLPEMVLLVNQQETHKNVSEVVVWVENVNILLEILCIIYDIYVL